MKLVVASSQSCKKVSLVPQAQILVQYGSSKYAVNFDKPHYPIWRKWTN